MIFFYSNTNTLTKTWFRFIQHKTVARMPLYFETMKKIYSHCKSLTKPSTQKNVFRMSIYYEIMKKNRVLVSILIGQ